MVLGYLLSIGSNYNIRSALLVIKYIPSILWEK